MISIYPFYAKLYHKFSQRLILYNCNFFKYLLILGRLSFLQTKQVGTSTIFLERGVSFNLLKYPNFLTMDFGIRDLPIPNSIQERIISKSSISIVFYSVISRCV